MTIDGRDLIDWGFKPGRTFKAMIARANELVREGYAPSEIVPELEKMVPVEEVLRTNALPFSVLLEPENDLERENLASVVRHMDALMRVPTIKAGAVMPDACPSGAQMGTIPVGGVVAAENAIHPGFHSSDICCSVAISVFKRNDDPKRLLDAVQKVTHFGPGGRPDRRVTGLVMSEEWIVKGDRFLQGNWFLRGLERFITDHFATQGDGNHFAFVGHLRSTGQLALVTHHGSRGLGAQLYKRGMAAAQRHTAIVAPRVPKHNAWLPADTDEGRAYWEALQFVRRWTRESHFEIHGLAQAVIGNQVVDRFWNEHNFVFRKPDGLFYHGKGATPSWSGFADDDSGVTLIPLNMAEPILLTRHTNNPKALGFAPHGAGRNMGRKAFLREQTPSPPPGIDVRSFCGVPDLSEYPAAYKDAASVRGQIERFGLAEVFDQVDPYGCIMAGDWERDAHWRKAKSGNSEGATS